MTHYFILAAVATQVLAWSKGIDVLWSEFWVPALVFIAFGLIGKWRKLPMATNAGVLIGFSALYAVLVDASLAHYGDLFDSVVAMVPNPSWMTASRGSGWYSTLYLGYFSLVPMMLCTIAMNKHSMFLRRFAACAFVSVLFLVGMPVRGNYIPGDGLEYIAAHFDALKTIDVISYQTAEGVVSMPSMHTALGILIIAEFWNTKLRYPALILNALMIFSTIEIGRHYVLDLAIGGAMAVAFVFCINDTIEDDVVCGDGL